MVVIPDGFLVPFKDDGYIYIVDISGSTPRGPYKLTDHTEGKWFYHRVLWKDMDGDGNLDILTCRAREPVFSIFCKLKITFNFNFQVIHYAYLGSGTRESDIPVVRCTIYTFLFSFRIIIIQFLRNILIYLYPSFIVVKHFSCSHQPTQQRKNLQPPDTFYQSFFIRY